MEEKKIASYHEAGHALVSSVLKHADPVHKVSVVSRGRAAGYTPEASFGRETSLLQSPLLGRDFRGFGRVSGREK